MKKLIKKMCAVLILVSGTFAFAQEISQDSVDSGASQSQQSQPVSQTQPDESPSFGRNLLSLESHRFIEIRGALPFFPTLTTHGMVQSFVVGFADVFGSAFAVDGDYDSTTPKFATDLNLTIFPPVSKQRWGFMLGAALDTWDSSRKLSGGTSESETISMNFYYIGGHVDYGHFVFSEIGTRLSLYGEACIGWLKYIDDEDDKLSFCFDVCPFGIQFCPEKHIGIYFEIPHFGARPFFQTGVSIGF